MYGLIHINQILEHKICIHDVSTFWSTTLLLAPHLYAPNCSLLLMTFHVFSHHNLQSLIRSYNWTGTPHAVLSIYSVLPVNTSCNDL